MYNRKSCLIRLLCVCLLITLVMNVTASFAESSSIFAIDLSSASDAQLEEARQAIVQEQKSRIVTKLVLDQDDITIEKGKTATIKADVTDLPEGVNAGKMTWSSTDANVASVQNGTVRAVNGGKATIKCQTQLSDGTELDAECSVTVKVIATGLTLTPKDITLNINSTQKLSPVIKPDNVSSNELKYSSDDSNIVSVDSQGTIKAVHGGKTTITVTTTDGSNKSAKVTVYVPSVSASRTEYSVTSKSGMDFSVKYYGTSSNLNVTKSGNNADVQYSLSGNDLTISVIPKTAGQITVTVADKSDARSKASIKVKIEHSAVYDQTSYPNIKYTDAARYPSNYQGSNCSFSGKVLQVIDGWGTTSYRISSRGSYNDVVYVTISNSDLLVPVLEDDKVTVYGTYDGNYSYTTIFGAQMTIPSVTAERINVR